MASLQHEDMLAHERNVLSRAKEHLLRRERDETLEALVEEYEHLVKLLHKISSISDVQGLALKKQEADMKNLLDHINQGILTIGPELIVQKQYSAECTRIFGRKIHKLPIADLLFVCSQKNQHAERLQHVFVATSRKERLRVLGELPTLLEVGGKDIHAEYKLIEEEGPSHPAKLMIILTDITEKLDSQAKVEYLSFHDALTSLYNRAYIDHAIERLVHPDYMPLSILIADMNGLKLTNDVFGHQKGDEFLLEAASIMTSCCREQDIVARWGGDEFMILLPKTGAEECQTIIESIHAACEQADADPVQVSFAVGAATMEEANQSIDEMFSMAEARMYKAKLLDASSVRKRMMDGMIQTLLGDSRTNEGHMGRVEGMAVRFAEKLGYAKRSLDLRNLRMLAALHDVGNIGVSKDILHKSGAFTEAEWESVQQHSEIGYRIAQSLGENVLAEAILYMHEWWDGSGYPHRLRGKQIPQLSRLLMIVDVYDVLTHDQVYRAAVSHADALQEMASMSGKQFDPELLDVFITHADEIIGV